MLVYTGRENIPGGMGFFVYVADAATAGGLFLKK